MLAFIISRGGSAVRSTSRYEYVQSIRYFKSVQAHALCVASYLPDEALLGLGEHQQAAAALSGSRRTAETMHILVRVRRQANLAHMADRGHIAQQADYQWDRQHPCLIDRPWLKQTVRQTKRIMNSTRMQQQGRSNSHEHKVILQHRDTGRERQRKIYAIKRAKEARLSLHATPSRQTKRGKRRG